MCNKQGDSAIHRTETHAAMFGRQKLMNSRVRGNDIERIFPAKTQFIKENRSHVTEEIHSH
jgi:hypothetical protein